MYALLDGSLFLIYGEKALPLVIGAFQRFMGFCIAFIKKFSYLIFF
jgi:hypothetical protein